MSFVFEGTKSIFRDFLELHYLGTFLVVILAFRDCSDLVIMWLDRPKIKF